MSQRSVRCLAEIIPYLEAYHPETQTEMLSHWIQRDNLGILWDEELNEAWLENAVFVLKNLTWKYWVDETSQTSTFSFRKQTY